MASFSEDCENALLACGYDPDSFGSYKHTQNQIKAAKKRCEEYDAAVEAGEDPGPPPLPSDRHMANCQAGHLSQDATHRAPGSRGRNCGNLNTGYDTNLSPCMPQSAGAQTPGSEHNAASRHEMASAEAGRTAPPNPGHQDYDPALRDVHESDRIRQVVDTDDPNAPRERIDPDEWRRRRNQAGSEGGDVPTAGAPGDASGTSPEGSKKSSLPATDEEKQKAAECIDAFRKAGLENMKSETEKNRADNAAANREKFEQAGGEAETERLRERRDEAQEGLDDLTAARDQAQRQEASRTGHARTQTARADSDTGTDRNRESSIRNAEGAQEARRTRENANMLISNQERAVNSANNAVNSHREAGCLADEGDAINGGNATEPPGTARAPSTHQGWADSDYNQTQARQDAAGLPGLPPPASGDDD